VKKKICEDGVDLRRSQTQHLMTEGKSRKKKRGKNPRASDRGFGSGIVVKGRETTTCNPGRGRKRQFKRGSVSSGPTRSQKWGRGRLG